MLEDVLTTSQRRSYEYETEESKYALGQSMTTNLI